MQMNGSAWLGNMISRFRWTRRFVLLAMAGTLAVSSVAAAEVGELRIARQFGVGYLPLAVMKGQGLFEKHAKRLGLGPVKLIWSDFTGGSNMNDALLSGDLDIATGGVPPFITLWSRSNGSVKIVTAMSEMPLLLNTIDPKVRSIKDFAEGQKIALPAVRTSNQAVLLAMAADKLGPDEASRLGKLTVSMSHPDAAIALLNGQIAAHFAAPPFQYQELRDARVHTVLNSKDVMGPFTFTIAWSTVKFRQENPKTYEAFVAAISEAVQLINSDKSLAAEIYLREARSKESPQELAKQLADPDVVFTTTPQSLKRYADYMRGLGLIKVQPESWQDLSFENLHGLSGS